MQTLSTQSPFLSLQLFGQNFIEQSSPMYPALHLHVPFSWQIPFEKLQEFGQVNLSHEFPVKFFSQKHLPEMHIPFALQFSGQFFMSQEIPVQPLSQITSPFNPK